MIKIIARKLLSRVEYVVSDAEHVILIYDELIMAGFAPSDIKMIRTIKKQGDKNGN